jgi:hypothetical protein
MSYYKYQELGKRIWSPGYAGQYPVLRMDYAQTTHTVDEYRVDF